MIFGRRHIGIRDISWIQKYLSLLIFISIIYSMNKEKEVNQQSRPKFRSYKYNVCIRNRRSSQCGKISTSLIREHNSTIINVEKFNSVLKPQKSRVNLQHFTMDTSAKRQDIYLQTFTTFFSRDYIQCHKSDNKENEEYSKVIMPQFNDKFDQCESYFTFLDTMVKPVKFINSETMHAEKELKRQKNDVAMLRTQFQALQNQMNKKLEDVQKDIFQKIKDLKLAFQNNQVKDQQRRLRNKKQIQILEKGTVLNQKIVSNLKQRNLQVQSKIFACHPYQLDFLKAGVIQINQNDYM